MLSMSEKKKQRQELILSSLSKLKFATREQIQSIHGLGSDRNALRILRELNDYMHVKTHDGRNVYYLSALGRDVVGTEEEMKWNSQVDHHLMRNDLYIYLGMPRDWEIERRIEFKYQASLTLKDMYVVPDARFIKDGIHHFVEVDRTQSMVENKKKLTLYQHLVPAIKQQYGHTPVLIIYTLTNLRKEKLQALCKEYGISCKVYTKEDTR
jgi:hypothetical protein